MNASTDSAKARFVSRFIPLTRQAVIADLCNMPDDDGERSAFVRLAHRLHKHRSQAYRKLAMELRQVYLPFSPDRDTVRALALSPEERQVAEERLASLTAHLLDRANYQRVSSQELDEILSAQSPYSLRIEVDLSEYDELQVYTRETYVVERTVRRPETGYILKSRYDERVYRRLFVLLKLKPDDARAEEIARSEKISLKKAMARVKRRRRGLPPDLSPDSVYVKVFKDLSQHDLQILFPLRTVQFRPFDKIKFYATAGGGTLFGAVSASGKLLAATNPIAAAGTLVAFVGLVGRQVAKFFNQRNLYMMELSQKLFFHNLANNRAAITLLLDRAEEEEVKEDLITLYYFQGERFGDEELAARKRKIEETLAERYNIAVDFELPDALARLERDGVATRENGTVTFTTLEEASEIYARLIDAADEEDEAHVCDRGSDGDVIEA